MGHESCVLWGCVRVSNTACISTWIISTMSNWQPFNLIFNWKNGKKLQGTGQLRNWVRDDRQVVFSPKAYGEQGNVRQCIVVLWWLILLSPNFRTMYLHTFMQVLQNITIKGGIYCLACWNKFFVHTHLMSKKNDEHSHHFDLHLSCLFWYW